MKKTQIKTSSLSLTLEPGNKILARSIFLLLLEKTRTQNKRWAGFNNTASTLMPAVTNTRSFQCRETKHAYKWLSFKKMPIHFFYMVVLWLKTSIISYCETRLHLMQTRNFQLLNTWQWRIQHSVKISTSKSHRTSFRSLILRVKKNK